MKTTAIIAGILLFYMMNGAFTIILWEFVK